MPEPVAEQVRALLDNVQADFTADGEVLLAVGNAISVALLDIAAAIREGHTDEADQTSTGYIQADPGGVQFLIEAVDIGKDIA